MAKTVVAAWELFAIMDENGKLVRVVAKNPDRPSVTDITADLLALLWKATNDRETAIEPESEK